MSEQIDVTQELAKLQQRVEHLEERVEKAESKESPFWRFSGTSGKVKKVET